VTARHKGARTGSATSPPPYLDEHTTAVAAGVDDVWIALSETLDRTFSGARAG
jgi:hypothetical protein